METYHTPTIMDKAQNNDTKLMVLNTITDSGEQRQIALLTTFMGLSWVL